MPDTDASKLDAWRWSEAERQCCAPNRELPSTVSAYYRRLVREDVRPPAEPDQDLIDLRAIFSAWDPEALLIMETAEKDFALAKAALIAIKARVRGAALREDTHD